MSFSVPLIIVAFLLASALAKDTCTGKEYDLHSSEDKDGKCVCTLSNGEHTYHSEVGSPVVGINPLPNTRPSFETLKSETNRIKDEIEKCKQDVEKMLKITGIAEPIPREVLMSYVGPAGRPGHPGAHGRPGATGATGATGLGSGTGPIGPRGPTGATGATGRGHDGVIGSQGIPGRRGATGQNGATGDTGRTGPGGWLGKRGATGATGATGVRGLSRPRLGPDDSGLIGPN